MKQSNTSHTHAIANRWRRLLATGIDLVLFVVLTLAVLLVGGVLERPEAWEYHQLIPRVALLIVGGYLLTHGYMLYRHGHTLGKHWLGLRIVNTTSGDRLAFWRLLWLRGPFLPMLLLVFAGPAALIPLLDSLLVFSPAHRCAHDYIAGSRVVNTANQQQMEL